MVFHKPVQLLGIGVALSVVGLGLALISGAMLAEGYAVRTWTRTQAKIVRSEVAVTQKQIGIRRGGAPVLADHYEAQIEYQYTAGGQTLVGNKVAIASIPGGFNPRVAEATVAKYPLGSQVTISYNPRDPSSAVIDPTVTVGLWWAGVVAGLVALVAGGVVWLKAIRLDEAQRATTQVPAASTPVRTRPAQAPAAPWAPPVTVRQVAIHWLLRVLAVLLGLPILLLGGLSFFVAFSLKVGAGAADMIALAIVFALIVGIILLGAGLLWIGIKGAVPMLSFRAAFRGAVVAPAAGEPTAPQTAPDFGPLIAQCGPQHAGLTNYLIFGAAMLAFAVVAAIAPFTFMVPKPGDEAGVKGMCWLFGGLSFLCGLGMMWKPLFGQNQTILLYERGLVERIGALSYAIGLDEIELLRVQEWYDNRFAPRTFNVKAKVRGDRELSFSSALRGESQRIIDYLAQRVRTEMIPFQA